MHRSVEEPSTNYDKHAWALILGVALTAGGCATRFETPAGPVDTSASGRAPSDFQAHRACEAWEDASDDDDARSHVSYPEKDPRGCYIPVHYDGETPLRPHVPAGCGFPSGDSTVLTAHWQAEAARYRRAADAGPGIQPDLPMPVACALSERSRRAASLLNARTLERLAERAPSLEPRAYALGATFGFGHAAMESSALVDWLPTDACPSPDLGKREMDKFSINRIRAYRASALYLQGIAPVVSFSGGAVHSSLTEAYMHTYLASCRFGVPRDAIFVDPCADHTHTNVRNTGSLVRSLGARTAFVVTDDGLQSDYLQDWTLFDLIGGSIDQRALRDWGYLLGSWRQASVGMKAGFWFTPYRFWGDATLGELSCVR